MKSAKICYQCLAPMKDCRKPEEPKTCSKQLAWGLKCKHCNSTSHHSLICPTKPTQSYQTDTQNDNHRGGPRGGGRGGRGGGRGGRGGRGRGRGGQQNNDKRQSSNQHENQSYQLNSSGPDPSSNNGCADQSSCNTRQLHNNPNQQKQDMGQVQGQAKKNVSFDLSNANFMAEQDPEVLRAQFNIPRDAPINTHYIGETFESDIVNAFSSHKSPQRLKAVIQCVFGS